MAQDLYFQVPSGDTYIVPGSSCWMTPTFQVEVSKTFPGFGWCEGNSYGEEENDITFVSKESYIFLGMFRVPPSGRWNGTVMTGVVSNVICTAVCLHVTIRKGLR